MEPRQIIYTYAIMAFFAGLTYPFIWPDESGITKFNVLKYLVTWVFYPVILVLIPFWVVIKLSKAWTNLKDQ